MSFICPKCEEEGDKQPRRNCCTDCYKGQKAAQIRRWAIRTGRIDPHRSRGRPSKGNHKLRLDLPLSDKWLRKALI